MTYSKGYLLIMYAENKIKTGFSSFMTCVCLLDQKKQPQSENLSLITRTDTLILLGLCGKLQ